MEFYVPVSSGSVDLDTSQKQKISAPVGNRTQDLLLAGENTNHYATEKLLDIRYPISWTIMEAGIHTSSISKLVLLIVLSPRCLFCLVVRVIHAHVQASDDMLARHEKCSPRSV